jgi:hypothetical protein
LLTLSSTRSTIPTIWEMSFLPLSPLCQPVGRCPFEPQPLGPEWTNSHQCTSWPFCPPDGLRFFHSTLDGVYHSPLFFAADHYTFVFIFWFLAVFPLDVTSHMVTLLTFLLL